jgi:cell division protease FtsH
MNMANAAESLRPLALLAAGKTGADIERLVREERAQCRRKSLPLTWDVLEEALRRDDGAFSVEVRHRIAVHEIGHALAFEMTGLGEVVSVRLHASGGKTETLLNRDRLQFAEGICDNLTCILGGRAAETVVFRETLVGSGGGSHSDLGQATLLALELETALGLGGDAPLVYRMPINPSETLLYNTALADRVQKRLADAERRAIELLEPYREVISALGHRLLKAQALEGEAIRAALAAYAGAGEKGPC